MKLINELIINEINYLAKCYEISSECVFISEFYGSFTAFKKTDLEK